MGISKFAKVDPSVKVGENVVVEDGVEIDVKSQGKSDPHRSQKLIRYLEQIVFTFLFLDSLFPEKR